MHRTELQESSSRGGKTSNCTKLYYRVSFLNIVHIETNPILPPYWCRCTKLHCMQQVGVRWVADLETSEEKGDFKKCMWLNGSKAILI